SDRSPCPRATSIARLLAIRSTFFSLCSCAFIEACPPVVMGYFSLIAVLVEVVLVALARHQCKQVQEFTSGHGPEHTPQPGSLESHRAPSLPSSVHSPSGPGALGHAMLGQDAGLLQLTSQLHDAEQSIMGHATPPPVHRIEHSRGPQLMLPHAP